MFKIVLKYAISVRTSTYSIQTGLFKYIHKKIAYLCSVLGLCT